MRAYNFATGIDLATTADGTAVNMQSSLVKPSVYLKGVIQAVTATSASPAVFTAAATALPNGTPVTLGGTAAPAGFTAGTTYYVVASGTGGALKFKLAATVGGAAINSSDTGTAVVANAMVDYGSGAVGGYDEDGKQGFPFTPGNSVVVAIQSAADHAGTSVALQGADPNASDPTIAGSYVDLARVSGISTATRMFNVVLKQFLRWDVVADGAEGANVAAIILLGQ